MRKISLIFFILAIILVVSSLKLCQNICIGECWGSLYSLNCLYIFIGAAVVSALIGLIFLKKK